MDKTDDIRDGTTYASLKRIPMNSSLKSLNRKGDPARRRPANLLGLDFGFSGVKAVRLKKGKEGVELIAADILPKSDPAHPERPNIPKPLFAYYTALCASFDESMLRVFTYPMKEGEPLEEAVRENLSVSANYRVAARVIDPGSGRHESTILGAAITEESTRHFTELFANGAPAPHSLELAGLAAFSSFWMTGGDSQKRETICLIEAGARYTYIAFFHKNKLLLTNRFSVGSEALSEQVQETLGVDADMARTVLSGGSVDISGPVRTVLGPFLKQLSIYREFIERQHKTRLTGTILSGGLSVCPCWQIALHELLDMEPEIWNPFDRLIVPDELNLEPFKGQEGRFAAAVGAALAGMEEGG